MYWMHKEELQIRETVLKNLNESNLKNNKYTTFKVGSGPENFNLFAIELLNPWIQRNHQLEPKFHRPHRSRKHTE